MKNTDEYYDVLKQEDVKTEIKVFDKGFVKLVDVMPRIVLKGRTIESRIIETARISTNSGLKDIETDRKLLRYLFRNYHTSPFENVKFTFHFKVPLFVRTHLIRHRTANVNEFSQRYAEIKKDEYWTPDKNSLRTNLKKNPQSSEKIGNDDKKKLIELELERTDLLLQQIFQSYHKLLDLGLSREIARFCLPESTYTELFYTMDLNNLMKMLYLRLDEGAQYETQVVAQAMLDLITPLIPDTINAWKDYRTETLTFYSNEISSLKTHDPFKGSQHESEIFHLKCKKIGIEPPFN